MGEPLYSKEAPIGYKDVADAWLSTANVMARIRFADALVNGTASRREGGWSRACTGKSRAEIARELLGRDPPRRRMAGDREGAGRRIRHVGTDRKPWSSVRRNFRGGNRYAHETNFSAWLGNGDGRRRLGSFLARTRRRIRRRQAQNPGCDLSARRRRWIERRGSVRGEALLRTAPHHRHHRAGQVGSRATAPSISMAASACIPRCSP